MNRVITSPARARAIVEEVAARFDLAPDRVLNCHGEKVARGEVAWRLKRELHWSLRRSGALLGVSHKTVARMLANHAALLASFQSRVEREHKLFLQSPEALELRELREKLARLTGADIANDIAEDMAIPKRCAIVLGMLAERYPRALAIEAMCELYDDACERLDYGFKSGADRELIRKNVSDLNRAFAAKGLPLAAEIAPPIGGRRLTAKTATMLSARYGVPRQSQLLHGDERKQERGFNP